MASSMAWRTRLNGHPVWRRIRATAADRETTTVEASSVVGCSSRDGVLYVWDGQSILAIPLSASADNDDDRDSYYQTLTLTNSPKSDVHSLVLNASGRLAALVGRQTVVVARLPFRTGPSSSSSSSSSSSPKKERLLCKSNTVGEWCLSGRVRVDVLQASWHPGSANDCHLAVLTSDNFLRIYDCSKANNEEPQSVYCLGAQATYSLISRHRTFLGCLGDTAVAFDFAPAYAIHQQHQQENAAADPQQPPPPPPLVVCWPVFVLRGNGDVYSLVTDIGGNNNNASKSARVGGGGVLRQRAPPSGVRGPLTMHPPAEDNYGVDACSLLCVPSSPPLLVIATSSGTLHHCLVLSKGPGGDDNDGSEQDDDDDERGGGGGGNSTSSDQSLYVVESVELELALSTLSLETGDLDEVAYTCPIRLMPDPSCPMRYHCCHSAGVHTVALPLIAHLEKFLNPAVYSSSSSSTDHQDDGSSLVHPEQACIVEHLVCTRPLHNSPPSPVLGVAVYDELSSAGALLLCLTADVEMIVLRLAPFYHDAEPPLLVGQANRDNDERELTTSSAMFQVTAPTFESHIRKMLQRTSSNPILKSSASADLSPQEGLQLLGRVTQVFRVEYMQRLESVRQEIQRRVKTLDELKMQQIRELADMEKDKLQLTTKAQYLAERYEEAVEKQDALTARVEGVLQRVQQSLPVVSDAERSMHRELEEIHERLNSLDSSFEQAKTKREYQQRQKPETAGLRNREVAALSETRKKQLYEILQNQSVQLSDAMRSVTTFKRDLGL